MITYHITRAEYITRWKSKGEYITDLEPIKNDSLPNIKYFDKKIALQFSYTPLVVDQINYTIKFVNFYIVYDLDNWPKKIVCLVRLI